MQAFSPPPAFLEQPGEPPIKWSIWFEAFETYLGAIGASRFRAERKKCLLLHSLGFEGRTIFKHLPDLPKAEGKDALDDFGITVKKLKI